MHSADRANAIPSFAARAPLNHPCGLLAMLCVLALSMARPAAAQTDTWLRKASPDNWSNPGEWTLGVPDGSKGVAILLPSSVVNEDIGFTNNHALTVGAPATLNVLGGITLTNASSGVINDMGLLTLDAGGGIVNRGALQVTGTLSAQKGSIDNTGATIAVNGGTFLAGNVTGGTIKVSGGGKAELYGTIAGTTLDNVSGSIGPPGFAAVPILDGSTPAGAVTILGTFSAAPGTLLKGTINNEGDIVNSGGLGVSGSALLQGGGRITLSGSIATPSSPATLENLNNAINGYGFEEVDIFRNDAHGVVDANVAGKTLAITFTATSFNQGVLEATSGGILTIGMDSGPRITLSSTGGRIIANGGEVRVDNMAIEAGALTAATGGTIRLGDDIISASTTLTTSGGTLRLGDNGQTDLVGTTLNNVSGLLEAVGSNVNSPILDGSTGAGPVTIKGVYTGTPGSLTVLRGTINNRGTIQLNDALLEAQTDTYMTGGGTVVLAGTGHALIGSGLGVFHNVNNTVEGFGLLQPDGGFVNEASGVVSANVVGQTLFLNGTAFQNSGTVNVLADSTLQLENGATFTQTGGRTQIDGTLSSPLSTPLQINGGALQGTGFAGDGVIVGSGARVQPGDPGTPGTLAVAAYEQQSGGRFEELIGASGNGQLVALLGATLDPGARLDIDLLGGFMPSKGETFDIMDSILITGEFANAPASGFQMDGWDWSITYLPGEIDLEALNAVGGGGGGGGGGVPVPEPGSMAIFAAGLIALAGAGLRRRITAAR